MHLKRIQKMDSHARARSQGKGEEGAVKAKRMAIEHKRGKLTFGQTERESEGVEGGGGGGGCGGGERER